MAPPTKPGSPDTAVLEKIEKHLAELVNLSKKQLKTLRDLSGPPPR